jgi:hypothetical protein
MTKIVTFSRVFPSHHPKKGQPTYFVEAILTQLGIEYKTGAYLKWLVENNPDISQVFLMKFVDSLERNVKPKSHTIRSHKRPLKTSDFINPKCWAGKPYKKTEEGFWQIQFAPFIEVDKVFDIYTKKGSWGLGKWRYFEGIWTHLDKIQLLANNDGLDITDFLDWFNKFQQDFNGQVICWNESVNY